MRVGALACAMAMLAAGCTKVGTATGPGASNRWTVPGVVRMAIIAEPNTLNPVLSGLIQEGYMEGAIYDGLVMFTPSGELAPDLATQVPSQTNGGISADGKTITYHLRHGVRWQDGAPFTSADVAFTYQTYVNPKVNSFYTATYQRIVSVSTPDPYTVVLHLRKPFAAALVQFFERATGGYVIPKHLLEHSPDINTDDFSRHPVGTGPWKLVRWDHGSLIVLRANGDYFAGAPHVDEVDVRIVANPDTQLEMVRSHELDLAAQLVPSQYAQLQSIAGVRAVLRPTYLERFLTFNLRHAPFGDPTVRRALALALDRARIVQTAYNGTSTLGQTLIPPWSWAYDGTGAPPFDPALARSLLDRAGWTVGANGMRAKNGQPLAFILLNQTEITPLSTMAQEMQRAWRDLGVDVQIRNVPRNVIYGNPGLATDGKFDALIDDWGADTDPDRSFMIETKSFAPLSYNDAFYSDPDVDRWSEQAVATYDRAQRKALYSLIQRRINRDLPYVGLVWEGRIFAVNTDFLNFEPEAVSTDFWNSQDWRI
ncbi:MAG TPA: peptide ABC transporter substrate-binding protein [Candidatus Acidoferrales bacterium]|nr:peptide ABC transporter substrate-binding protein [Candidatus Acidoferrales bacterium]